MKIFLADLTSKLAKMSLRNSPFRDAKIEHCLEKQGYYVWPDYINEDKVNELLSTVRGEHANSESLKVFDDGADERLFGIDRSNAKFDFFIDNPLFNYFSYTIQGYSSSTKLIMSNIIRPISGNLGSGGGWHRDSPYRNQFKAFLFLTDVSMETGPLCFIEGSHKAVNIKKVSRFLNKPLSEYRFTDEEIETAVNHLGLKKVFVTCKAGSMLVANVRGLHRGTPIEYGERVALTNYYFKKGIPAHFGITDA